jgi:hypothetical protein
MPESELQDMPEETTGEEVIVDEAPVTANIAPKPVQVVPEPVSISAPVATPVVKPPMFSFQKFATGLIPKPRPKNELADLFQVPKADDNDMYVDDLFDVPEEDLDMEDNLDDLTQVSREDVMGKPPKPKARYKRTNRLYAGPTSMGGVQ